MSELIKKSDNRATIRWKLLTGASAFALAASVSAANAEDSHPVLWLDLGGQFDVLSAKSEPSAPFNLPPVITNDVANTLKRDPRIGYDVNAAFTYQAADSDWSVSASIQYGKAKSGPKFGHDQTYYTTRNGFLGVPTLATNAFTNLHSVDETKHTIIDFQAGKDVGLGLMGRSTVKFGVRAAQFRERANGLMTAATNVPEKYSGVYGGGSFLSGYMHADRSFTGIGPSLAWNGSVAIGGSLDEGLAFDWGANAALLFGRQKAKVVLHSQIVHYTGNLYTPVPVVASSTTLPHTRSRNVTVPNLGGFAGFSYRMGGAAKLSIGYRADFFFNAIDGGIDARKSENRGFYGPYASISIGLGD